MESKKFYWLKLKRDFFKRHDIFIIEGMDGGRDIVNFYIKLMLESVDHDGKLRFSEELPYNPELLASLTRLDLETVNRAIKVLESFGLMLQTEDGTYILPKVTSMIDSASDSDGARRMRRLREQNVRTSEQNVRTSEQNVTDDRTKGDESIEKEIEIEIEKELEIDKKRNAKEKTPTRFSPPSVEEVRTYCLERSNNVDPEAFVAFYESKGWKVGRDPMKNWKSAVITWEKRRKPEAIWENPFSKLRREEGYE